MKEIAGRTAFVTGGASGMGLAMVRTFAAAGMNVAVADIEKQALERVAEEFAGSNGTVITLPLDVTDRAAMEQAADATEEAFGKVHVVCNNAGVAVGGNVDTMSYADWDWVLGVNIDGVVNGVQTFTRRIEAHGEGGHFVNTASMAGHIAVPGLAVYTTSKFAVVGMSEVMRNDLAASNIGVSVLCPGVVRTAIFDSGRNRPANLAAERDTAAALLAGDGTDEEKAARVAELLENALDPEVVGDMVLHAIQNDEFYIFTHPEIQQITEARHAEMAAAFDRWNAYRQTHGV
ncbi:MAG: SDR family NAD(P)-dependent oxidoreductase [Gammaproteobacteria bacterium]|nr:SDR family NAD(P)-dependent oxidoreductase [Gammaproteobacteria bacterium]